MGGIRSILYLCKFAGGFPYSIDRGAFTVQPFWVVYTAIRCLLVVAAAIHLLLRCPDLISGFDVDSMADAIWVCTYTLCFLVSALYTACASSQLAAFFRMMESLNPTKLAEGKGSLMNDVKVHVVLFLIFISVMGISYGFFNMPVTQGNVERHWYIVSYVALWLMAGIPSVNLFLLFVILTWELKNMSHRIVSGHLLEKFAIRSRGDSQPCDISTTEGIRSTPPAVSQVFSLVSAARQTSGNPGNHSSGILNIEQLMVDHLLIVENHLIRINEMVEQLMRYFSLILIAFSLAICSAVTVFCYFLIDEYLSTSKLKWINLYGVIFAKVLYIAMNLGPDLFNAQVSKEREIGWLSPQSTVNSLIHSSF